MPRPLIDMTGQRIGSLMVLRRTGSDPISKSAVWECRCNCGRLTVVNGHAIRQGKRRACTQCSEPNRLPAGGVPPQEDIQEARQMMADGATCSAIREWFGWTRDQVRYAAEAADMEIAA